MNSYEVSREAETYKKLKTDFFIKRLLGLAVTFILFLIVALILLWEPITGPWSQERQGMANYRQAVQERRIIVAEAQGELDAAEAQADAIRTMGEAARNFPEYRTQVYIEALSQALTTGKIRKVIYIPAGGDLPVTEATRFAGE